MIKKWFWFLLVSLILFPILCVAGQLQPLDSGDLAGAWLINDKESSLVNAYLFILAGEIDNTGPEGLAHYTEHLVNSGNIHSVSSKSVLKHNAYTWKELMEYWVQGEKEDGAVLVDKLSQALQPLGASEDFANSEREIVQREFDLRKREKWRRTAWEDLLHHLHANDPRQRGVLGTQSSISRFNLNNAKAFHQRTHRRDNAVLVLRGNLSKGAAQKIVQRIIGQSSGKQLPGSERMDYCMDYKMAAVTRDVQGTSYSGVTQPELLYTKVVKLDAPGTISQLLVEAQILNNLLSSRLPGGLAMPLRYDNFYAKKYHISIQVLDKHHLMMWFSAVPDVGVKLDDLLSAFESALTASADKGVQSQVVEQIKQRILQRQEGQELSTLEMQSLKTILRLREMPVGFSKQKEQLQQVSAKSLSQRLRLLSGKGRVVARLIN